MRKISTREEIIAIAVEAHRQRHGGRPIPWSRVLYLSGWVIAAMLSAILLTGCNGNGAQIGSAAAGALPDAQMRWIEAQRAQLGLPPAQPYQYAPAYAPPPVTRCFTYGYQNRMQMCH